jgi:hypothetical protein
MNSQSLNSISFVTSAVYTVTFANTIYLMTVKDSSISFSLSNMSWSIDRVLCGIISLIMTLRFFFGNNQYISDVMSDKSKLPWVKFYHFIFIAVQSIILLICSYSIPNYISFINVITCLFSIEVIWYFLTMVVDKKGVLPDKKEDRKAFFYAEMTNLGFVVGVFLLSLFICKTNILWLWLVFLLFLINTIIDAKKNISVYMS